MTDHLPADRPPGSAQDPAAEIAQLTAELADLGEQAQRLSATAEADGEASTALVVAASSQAAEAKARMVRQLARLQRLQNDISQRQARLRELMEAQMAAAYRSLGPLKAKAARLQEGIDAFSLYLGMDEGIKTLRGGEPAEAATPVVLRQLVLSADQECMVAAESGGLDVEGLDDFFAWLLAAEENLNQVLPEPKGIVAMVPSRTQRSYGADPWFNAAMKEANAATFFLVRNGERLFAVFNELKLDQRMFPAADEFSSLFRDHQGRPLAPESSNWKAAEERASATRRHFMKVGLLLQGLIDRTTVLHPLPEQGLNLLDQKAIDTGQVVLIPDAEDAYALGDGHERFTDWQQRVNRDLRPGMRVIVASRSQAFRDLRYDSQDRRRGHQRLYPTTAEAPNPTTVHTIEQRRRDGGLIIRYERTDDVWTNEGLRPAKTRASCTLHTDDPFVLAYDAADPDLLRSFLRNRVDRKGYLEMVPVINAAIAAKEQERTAEAPFRRMVVGMLMQQAGASLAEAEEAVVGLVDWWKFANRVHRPLTGRGTQADAKAAQNILAEFRRRQHTDRNRASKEVVAALLAQHPDALLIAQTHDAHLILLTSHGDGPFVTEHTYNRQGEPRTSREWLLPSTRPNRWTTLHSTARWENWDRGATLAEHLTGPERDALANDAARHARAAFPDREVAAVTLSDAHRVMAWTVRSWGVVDEAHPATGKAEPITVEAYGLEWHRDRRQRAVTGSGASFGLRTWDRLGQRRPWEAGWGEKVSVLTLNTDLVGRIEAANAHHQAVVRRGEEIRQAARDAYNAAQAAWNKHQEQAAYKAFMAEYGEPSLWDGHRKTINLPPMPEPAHRTGTGFNQPGTSPITALATLIEAGEDLTGYTLGEALKATGVTDAPANLFDLPLHRKA